MLDRVSDWKLTKELTRKPSGLSGIEPDEHPCAYEASAEIGVVDNRHTSLSELLQFLLVLLAFVGGTGCVRSVDSTVPRDGRLVQMLEFPIASLAHQSVVDNQEAFGRENR